MKTKLKSSLTKCIIIFSFLFTSYLMGFSQEPIKENGFYVNYGNTQVNELDCFNFDNLVYTFEVTEEMFEYDKIGFKVEIYNSKLNKYDVLFYSQKVEGRIFQNKVKDKKYISFLVVDNRLESKNRENLAFTSEEEYTKDMVLKIQIFGGVVTGSEKKWNSYSESYITKPTYTYTYITPSNNEID